MRPRVLKLAGLNSFEEEQIINFDKLTEKGLFGIFGPTGSGKSTILDAITLALYGKITRSNKGYINTTRKNLTVSYEFQIGLGSDRKAYIAERNLKINKAGGYNTKYARLLEKLEDETRIICEGPSEVQSNIESIIGLTAEDFTRSVVLPQGKFSEFLRLTGKDKRDMLERIFSLEKYGRELGEKIKREKNKYLKEDNILTGELKKFEGLSEELLKEKENKLKDVLLEEKSIIKEKNRLDKDYEKFTGIIELQKELKEFKHKEKGLIEIKEEIKLKELRLEKGKKAVKIRPSIDDLINTEMSLEKNKSQLEDLKLKLIQIEKHISITEKEYEEINKTKEEEIPKLIKKEASLLQAIELGEKISLLKEEIDALRKSYSEIKNEKTKVENRIREIALNREEKSKQISDMEERLNQLKIEPEYRDKLQAALEKENEYLKSNKRKNDMLLKLGNRKSSLEDLFKEYNALLKNKEKQDLVIEQLNNKSLELEKINPGDNAALLEKSQYFNNLKEKLDKALKDEEKCKELKAKLINLKEVITPIEEEKKQVTEAISNKRETLEKLSVEIDHISKENLANMLREELEEGDPCPVCGSTHHIFANKEFDFSILETKEKEKKSLENYIEKLNNSLNELNIKLAGFLKEEEYINSELEASLKAIEGIDIDALKSEKNILEIELTGFKEKLNLYTKEREALESQLSFEKEKQVEVQMEGVKTGEKIKNEKAIIEDLEKEYKEEESNFIKLKEEYTSIKSNLQLEDISLKIKEMREAERETISLEKLLKEARSFIDKDNKEREELIEKDKDFHGRLGKITQSGKEKGTIIQNAEKEIADLSEGKDSKEYLQWTRNEISNINKENQRIKSKLEEQKKNKQNIWDNKVSLEEAEKMLTSRVKELNCKLEEILKENGFINLDQVLQSYIDKKLLEEMEITINTYNDEYKNVINNISRIEEKLNGEFIEEEAFELIKVERVEKEKLLNEKIKEIATLQNIINRMKLSIEELSQLMKKKEALEKKLSLLNDLSRLVEGNKFVEFVAMSQLKYIAREASRRLKSITKDRYALEIDGEGNFTIRDDFNGGEIRDTSTLSGGETFLASLALALALSYQVQLKGSAPLEFFFLDEGFGTLDSELLDIVMNSLESLHSSKLSVGIISHVEELKNRVPVKLIISPSKQGEGGSKIVLEYS